MIPILVISLKRSTDRRAYMTEHLGALGIPFTFVDGVDGRALPPGHEADLRHTDHPTAIGPYEIGCWLGHKVAWRAIIESRAPWGLVFEDDVKISPELTTFLRDLSWLPRDADIVKIEASVPVALNLSLSHRTARDRRLYKLRGDMVCAAGYFITADAAARLEAMPIDCRFQNDRFLFDRRSPAYKVLTTYLLDPALCIQTGTFASFLGLDRTALPPRAAKIAYRRPPLSEIIPKELRRLRDQIALRFTQKRVIDWR
jgi:glycosyl transferase family 25